VSGFLKRLGAVLESVLPAMPGLRKGRLAGCGPAECPEIEAVSKDPWQLAPPKNILNGCPFFLILQSKIKKNGHPFIIFFRRRRRRKTFETASEDALSFAQRVLYREAASQMVILGQSPFRCQSAPVKKNSTARRGSLLSGGLAALIS
jgi:hypothetical protein